MSARAYRINNIEYDIKREVFNLWHDEKLIEYLSSGGYLETLNIDGCGIIEIPVCELNEIIKNAKKLKLSKERIDVIKDDIKWAKKNKKEYIMYDCF